MSNLESLHRQAHVVRHKLQTNIRAAMLHEYNSDKILRNRYDVSSSPVATYPNTYDP
jgi:hypothetical protein